MCGRSHRARMSRLSEPPEKKQGLKAKEDLEVSSQTKAVASTQGGKQGNRNSDMNHHQRDGWNKDVLELERQRGQMYAFWLLWHWSKSPLGQ